MLISRNILHLLKQSNPPKTQTIIIIGEPSWHGSTSNSTVKQRLSKHLRRPEYGSTKTVISTCGAECGLWDNGNMGKVGNKVTSMY